MDASVKAGEWMQLSRLINERVRFRLVSEGVSADQ